MPVCRYHIRSAQCLADPELRRAAGKDDSEALLEAVAMAGLVGFLRQLGDLAQFAAELFHDLHEEVMATAARGHSLISRVQQLETEVPALEKAFLSHSHNFSFLTNAGIDWQPNLQSEKNLVTGGDLPRFVMDSYEKCRGPPRLFLLDKYDVVGAGACLKRYTDPLFFTADSASSVTATTEEVHREKRIRKVRQGAGSRNGETPEVVPSHTKLHQLFLEERIEDACTDPARLVKLRKKQLDGYAMEAKTGRSYMEKILKMPSPDRKMVYETSIVPQPVKLMSDDASETRIKILEISSNVPTKRSLRNDRTHSLSNGQELELNPYSEMGRETYRYLVKVHDQISAGVPNEISSNNHKLHDVTELAADEQEKRECILDGYHSYDAISEVDDYMDALATVESEFETDNECRLEKSILNAQNVTDSNKYQLDTQFSDSQSFGDSFTSEDISSIEQDRNKEQNEVQARFPNSQSIGNSSLEIENRPSNQLPLTVELQKTCGEFVMQDDTHDQGGAISHSRPVSLGSSLMEPGCLLLSSELGAPSLVFPLIGTQLDETPSGPLELHLRLEDDEDRKCLVESIASVSGTLSPIKDDACIVVSYDNNFLNNLHVCDPQIHSNALLQVSDDLKLAYEDECGDHSDVKVLQPKSLNEYSTEFLVGGGIGSQGGDPICLSMEADLNSGTNLLLDDRDLKPEHDKVVTQLNSDDLFPAADTTLESRFTEEPCSSHTHGNPHNEPGSAEVEVLYHDQRSNFEAVPRIMPGDEISGSTCSSGPVEDDGNIEHPPCDYKRQDNHVMGNDKFTVKVQSEDQAVSAFSSVDIAENDASIVDCLASDSISSPSKDLSNLHETFLCSSDSHQIEMESDEAELTKISVDLNAGKMENQQEPSSDIIFSPIWSRTKLVESLSTFADPHEIEMEVNEAAARESLTELTAHEVEDQPEIASTEVQLNLNRSLPSDPSVSGIFNNIQHSSLKEKIQYGSSINDMKMVTFQAQKMQLSNQLEQERVSDAASEFAAEVHPDESSHDSSSKTSWETNPTKHVMDPLKPLLSDLFPKATKTNLEEMPPMPPLPPMQWRSSKVQNASLVSQIEEKEVSQMTFQPIQPVNHDDKAQFGLSTPERETLLCHNTFFPVTPVESSNHQHSAGLSADVSEHAASIPLQFPVMVNEANGQPNYLVQERCQAQNPLLTSVMVSLGKPPHGYAVASEGERVLNSSPCAPTLPAECAVSGTDPIFQQEKPIQSCSQLVEESSLEVKTLEKSSINSDMEQGDPSVLAVSSPRDVQPNHNLALSLGASAQISNFHSEMRTGKPKNKLPPPPKAPSNDIVAALDKSRLRKVTERVRPQVAPKVDEKDSLLEQIRAKSFNLKPTVAKRPSILGPKTNLRVAAILEKANSFRQALAGSDEDDDADSWSDS